MTAPGATLLVTWGAPKSSEVVYPNVVCPDPNLLEWEMFDTNIEDGTAWNKIVVNGIHIHVFVFVHAFGVG
jgi:hypothetical protein